MGGWASVGQNVHKGLGSIVGRSFSYFADITEVVINTGGGSEDVSEKAPLFVGKGEGLADGLVYFL